MINKIDMDNRILLSFVIPCYRSEKTIELVVQEIRDVVSSRANFDYEVVTVNDCSPDGVYEVLRRLAAEDKKVKVINLSKNMGKHAAVMAGYSVVQGDYVINIDDDYQCPVDQVWKMVDPMIADECDVTVAGYHDKKESVWKRLGSKLNDASMSAMVGNPKGIHWSNYSAMKRFVCDEMVNYKNPYPFLAGLMLRVTRRVKQVELHERERADDNKSGFTFFKSVGLFINGMTAFSVKPLRVSTGFGALMAVIGIIWTIYIVIKRIVDPGVPLGYSSMMALILFMGGINFAFLGLIGEYLGRIYICINDSPQYVIKETINIQPADEAQA